jgi:hypothetical protein
MLKAIKRTLLRLSGKIYAFNPLKWYPLLIEGISQEFERFRQYKNIVFNSIVPNDNMDPGSIEDHNNKYGIPQFLSGTDQQKIDRLKEKASLNGFPGREWLQEQIQKAGFQLYVHESEILDSNLQQWGSFQWGTAGVNYGLTARYIDPATTEGVLVVGSPVCGTGRLILNRFGTFQWGTPGSQWGTPDGNALDPQPCQYEISTNELYWWIYFWLSPFPDRLAVDSSEFLEIATEQEFNYLVDLIIELKLQRNRCILQAKVV